MRILTVIPARGGSVRIPNKAMALLCGRPLIDYTLNIAKLCELNAVVSSDCPTILGHAAQMGFGIIPRPSELATSTATTVDVLRYATRCTHCDAVLCLQPTNPLRILRDVERALSLLANGFDSVCAAVRCSDRHPAWAFGGERTLADTFNNTQRAQLPPMYHRDGSIYLAKRELIEAGLLVGDNPGCVEIAEKRAVNIDEPHDLVIAEALFKAYMEKDYQWVL
jgi:CMP-N-acetylneuraminic acid synthetase